MRENFAEYLLVVFFLHSQSASALSRESGFVLESPTVTAFRNGVLEGKWETVVRLLQDEHIIEGVDVSVGLNIIIDNAPNPRVRWLTSFSTR